MRRNGFEHVGPIVEPGDVRISHKDATDFRQVALLGTKIHRLSIEELDTLIWAKSYATGILSTGLGDYGVDESAAFSKSVAGPEPGYWRSTINFVRYNSEHSDTKIYNIFNVESLDGDVISAIREVRIIRNLTRIAFNEETGEPYDDLYSKQNKSYELPMEPEDIGSVALRIEQLMNRQRVTATIGVDPASHR